MRYHSTTQTSKCFKKYSIHVYTRLLAGIGADIFERTIAIDTSVVLKMFRSLRMNIIEALYMRV
jgi:hypothetical protein